MTYYYGQPQQFYRPPPAPVRRRPNYAKLIALAAMALLVLVAVGVAAFVYQFHKAHSTTATTAPAAQSLCTPQQWQENPAYCQQVFQNQSGNSGAFARLVCNLVGQEPTPHGIWAANSYLLSGQDPSGETLNYGQMQNAIGNAIKAYCPQYNDIYVAWALPPRSGHGIYGYAASGSVAGVRLLS